VFSFYIKQSLRQPTCRTGQNGSAESVNKLMTIKLQNGNRNRYASNGDYKIA
jgi:hypothetical protein